MWDGGGMEWGGVGWCGWMSNKWNGSGGDIGEESKTASHGELLLHTLHTVSLSLIRASIS